MRDNFDLVIIGGGILGTSISYFLSFLNKSKRIGVIEQENNVAHHINKVYEKYVDHERFTHFFNQN